MSRLSLWRLAKVLEAIGLVVVLVGVSVSIHLGFRDQGLASMRQEFLGLFVGGAIFLAGFFLERWTGPR